MPIEFEIKPVRSVYGKPWSKMAGIQRLDRKTLNKVGKILVEEIVKEAKKELSAQGNKPTPIGDPEGLPRSREFFRSFHYKVRGSRTIEIYSNWPWILQLVEGRDEYKMTWLTQAEGVRRVPMKQPDGTMVIRMAPKNRSDAWIHPGFRKHKFLERGIKKGREKAAKVMLEYVAKQLANGDPMR